MDDPRSIAAPRVQRLAAGVVQPWPRRQGKQPNHHEVHMSADKDRAVRRQKQKRAKDLKKQARQQPAKKAA
ncbi:MAG: hypothetical protein Tsb007_38810 [Rhizobacter sp.]